MGWSLIGFCPYKRCFAGKKAHSSAAGFRRRLPRGLRNDVIFMVYDTALEVALAGPRRDARHAALRLPRLLQRWPTERPGHPRLTGAEVVAALTRFQIDLPAYLAEDPSATVSVGLSKPETRSISSS